MKLSKFLRRPFSYSFYNITLYIIALNIILYVAQGYFRRVDIPFENFLALHPFLFVRLKMFWQTFTYMFLHGDFWHIFFNMLALFWFGTAVERKVGSKDFLMFYLVCGTLSGLAMGFLYYFLGMYSYIVGASGALYAVMLAFAALYPDSNIYLYFVLPIPSAILVLIYFFMEVFQVFTNDGIAHLGHIFGLLFGWLYIRCRFGIRLLKVFGFR